MDSLLAAILDDDRTRVKELLKADSGLATRLIEEARLYQSHIFHWIYVGDTALHLAAAGIALRLSNYCSTPEPTQTQLETIVIAARCTTQRMVTSMAPRGMPKGK